MKSICLFFQVHQPFRYRRYRFFDIGNDHYYYDDYSNETIMRKIAYDCYLPSNQLFLKLIEKYKGDFKIAFSISGTAIDQFELYAPEVLESFIELSKTGCVEFLSETYSHTLTSLKDREIFENQVKAHSNRIFELFGKKPEVFKNTEMIYSDEIGALIANMGYKAVLTEGAKHILGWKSPNFLYVNAINPKLKMLMRNFKLSDDITFRFSNTDWSEYPLTPKKFTGWIKAIDPKDEIINIFLDYSTLGGMQRKDTGIFDFFNDLPQEILKSGNLNFSTPSDIIRNIQPVSAVSVPYPISWADEERDITAWLGNEMQNEAFDKLYSIANRMNKCDDQRLIKDWNYLQVSDHFYYMSTKFFSSGEVQSYFNPYDSPYEAFINYMNVLSDFRIRLNTLVPENMVEQEIASLNRILEEKEAKILKYKEEIKKLRVLKKSKKTSKK